MKYKPNFKFNLVYVIQIDDERHRGALKVGDATARDDCSFDEPPNSDALNKSAHLRIREYTTTAAIPYQLLHAELTLCHRDGKVCGFTDKDVHKVLENSGYKRRKFPDVESYGNEWFEADLDTIKRAIKACKRGESSLLPGVTEGNKPPAPIQFRPEQRKAIDQTVNRFQKGDKMLWNAKMRFGKTLSALQVAREMDFKRTLILTHRPVVNQGWYEDFRKIFFDRDNFAYGSRQEKIGWTFRSLEEEAAETNLHYVYFASMEDLRGSQLVGGSFDKNEEIFSADWNFIIVDEAHEGTQTELGQAVLNLLLDKKPAPRLLELSGTPFNLLDQYSPDEVYTWDYGMEQEAKEKWDEKHFGDPNPYIGLPRLNMRVYNLGDVFKPFQLEGKFFNFREFFRVQENGSFLHEHEVRGFLDLMTKEDDDSFYPFANEQYRSIFRHTLWMVPGVREAKALSTMLQEHPVFRKANFEIVNVAGDGDEYVDAENRDALKKVQDAIGPDPDATRTITLSCGRLTTGVSVPAWTAVLMLSGSYNTAASGYLQTIFRVQTPATINGRRKEECYVFDFAPDRTLTVLAEAAQAAAMVSDTASKSERENLERFLNFLPVISYEGSRMVEYSAHVMLAHIRKAQIERVIRTGFEDTKLYNNDLLLKLEGIDLNKFNDLNARIGKTKALPKTKEIVINSNQLDGEKNGNAADDTKTPGKHPDDTLSAADAAERQKRRVQQKNRQAAISILRGISIRMPLLIYGAELQDDTQDITIDNFTDIVDDVSWKEFMPDGVTKKIFNEFRKYYDETVFREAGQRIRAMARAADELDVEDRIARITDIFAHFRNPDKETVLTPWRVVNLHLGSALGGWAFFDEAQNYTKALETPHFADRGPVTAEIFSPTSKVLEINAKSGLYPLYVSYSIFRSRLKERAPSSLPLEEQLKLWDRTLTENVFVVCKSPMARAITKRTLIGFRSAHVNVHYFPHLINTVRSAPQKIIRDIRNGQTFWKNNTEKAMKFNAVVGNPPYQEMVAQKETNNGQKRSSSIFQHFQELSDKLGRYSCLIYPGARWIHRSGKGLEQFGFNQINDPHLAMVTFYPDASEIFPGVSIADGLSIVLKDAQKTEQGFHYVHSLHGTVTSVEAACPGDGVFVLNPKVADIARNLEDAIHQFASLHDSVLSQKLFGIESDFVEKNPNLVRLMKGTDDFNPETEVKLFTNDKAGKSGRARWYAVRKEIIESGGGQVILNPSPKVRHEECPPCRK